MPLRSRDIGRKYKSVYSKKVSQENTEKLISELPKLSKWYKKDAQTESDADAVQLGSGSSIETSITKKYPIAQIFDCLKC